jgi:phosphate:Na+ symporter
MSIVVIGTALGGIGLFLLGMRLMTDGLKVAAGGMLRDILGRWTRTSARGLLSGFLITGVVQSSSAVTVATIGFVNARVLTLRQAMWVIFGSNVGTTMTAWIVAAVGFDFRIEPLALPLLGIGMFLSLSGVTTRRGALGEALAGFGVFFLGIATLKTAFGDFGKSIDVADFAAGGVLGDAIFVGVGFVLTALVQSSSAVVAIALTAAAGGLLSIESGAALVIGANVGTTTTALLAVIGATANAKRVAVSHVAFNVLTGAVALAMLPLLVVVVEGLERTLRLSENPETTLALFHTAFNLLGILLIWPFARSLERWLATRFVSREEDEARPRHLDRTALGVPALAVTSMLLELERLARMAVSVARAGFTEERPDVPRLQQRREAMDRLGSAIGDYARELTAARMSSEVAEAMAHPFRAIWHLGEIADRGISAGRRRAALAALPEHFRMTLASYATLVVAELDAFLVAVEKGEAYRRVAEPEEDAYQRLKAELLSGASSGAVAVDALSAALEMLDDLHVSLRFLERASRRLLAVAAVGRPEPVAQPPADAP